MGVCRLVCEICLAFRLPSNGYRYEKRKRQETSDTMTYHFVGYSSLYPFYFFPEKTRMRLRYTRFQKVLVSTADAKSL